MEYWQNLNRLSQAQQQATAQPEAQAFQPAAGFQTGAQNLQTFLQVGAAFFKKDDLRPVHMLALKRIGIRESVVFVMHPHVP